MNISELKIRNFKIIGDVVIQPVGRVILISGKNGMGKSTVFDAVMAAMRGAKFVPEKPIKSGKVKGEIVCKLRTDKGVLTVERTFSEKKEGTGYSTQLSVYDDKQIFCSPQSVLDGLLGAISLDPSEFVLMKQEQQFQTLRQLVPLVDRKGNPVDPDQIKHLNELDYKERARLNRQHKDLSAEISVLSDQLPQNIPEKEIDMAEVSAQLAQASEHNSAVKVAAERKQDSAKRLARNIELAKRKQEEARAALQQAEADQKLFEAWHNALAAEKEEALIDTAELAAKLQAAQEMNRLVAMRRKRDELAGQAKKAYCDAEDLTAVMDEREKVKNDALARAKFPIPGLAFGEGEVIYQGQPFSQASSSEQIRVGCAIAMALRPEIRVMNIKHGNLLDKQSWQIVSDMAEEKDWQIWTEMVTEEKIGITMMEGSVQS